MNTAAKHLADDPHYVYTLSSETEILYVGCTYDLIKRLGQHRSSKPWWSDVTYYDVVRYDDQASGLKAERALIEQHQPLHNREHTERFISRRETLLANRRARHERGESCRSNNRCPECRIIDSCMTRVSRNWLRWHTPELEREREARQAVSA